MQGARDQLFAGARLPGNHYREVSLHQPCQHTVDFLHRRRAADERHLIEIVGLDGSGRTLLRFRQCATDDGNQLLEIERLGQDTDAIAAEEILVLVQGLDGGRADDHRDRSRRWIER